MNWQETVGFLASCMPKGVGKALREQPENSIREIRLRSGGNISLICAKGEQKGSSSLTQAQVAQTAEALCEHALYARVEEQRHGFVTLRGGHRMGLCGRVITQGQTVRALREISSLCIRVAGQWRGAADPLLPHLTGGDGRMRSILIVGMPGSGKTTILRDACRQLSEKGAHMCVVDERSEIAAMCGGIAQLDVGPNTDVLDGCCKEAGMRWMLRAMSPEVLVTDELGGAMDVQAISEAARCGVSVMTTLHGRDLDAAMSRGMLYQLVKERIFERYVQLDDKGVGKIAGIYDEQMRPIVTREAV